MKKSCLNCKWCKYREYTKYYKFECAKKRESFNHYFMKGLFCRHYEEKESKDATSYAEKLNKALDESCKRLASICEEGGYCEELYCPYKKTDRSCMNMCNFSTIWREELMK